LKSNFIGLDEKDRIDLFDKNQDIQNTNNNINNEFKNK
jgi:hypothetical protein